MSLRSISTLAPILILGTCAAFLAGTHAGEPTNAQELAAKKAEQQKVIDERFAKWKAALPAEQQAW
jgi:hypothetical protein